MTRTALVAAGLLMVAFLVLLSPFILHPSLYTIENESSTPSQANPAALDQLPQEKSGELFGLMQDLLDTPQPIVLNIRIRAFEEYRERQSLLPQIVLAAFGLLAASVITVSKYRTDRQYGGIP